MKEVFPAWYYGPDGQAKIFNSAEEIPIDWVTHPSLLKEKTEAKKPEAKKVSAPAKIDTIF